MNKPPNYELFRLVRFAIKYPGWHTYAADMRKHVKRAAKLGLLEDSPETMQFRLPLSRAEKDLTPVIKAYINS